MNNLLHYELFEKIQFPDGCVEKLANQIMYISKDDKVTAYKYIDIAKGTLGSEGDLDFWNQAKEFIEKL